jgi:nucleoside-diphosphate-sugar epimerase
VTLLVTGATGFLGRHLTERLRRDKVTFRAAVRSSDRTVPGADIAVVGEIDGATRWGSALAGVHSIIHIAGRAHAFGADTRGEFHRVNVEGTEALVRAAADAGVRRLVLLSTAKVHGEDTSGHPMRESDRPAPSDAYARSKLEAEEQARLIATRTGVEIVVVRTPLVYGAGVRANFRSLLHAVARGFPLPFGRVRNARSLIYAGNLVDALLVCTTAPQAAGETFLVSDGAPQSTPELIRAIARALHRPARLLPIPPALLTAAARLVGRRELAARLVGSFVVDSSRIANQLGWRPPVSVPDALDATADWYWKSAGRGQ